MNTQNQRDGSSIRITMLLVTVVTGLMAVGCDRGPKIVPVTGKVTLDGKPMPFKSVYFFPDRSAATEGNGAGGYTDADSNYYLMSNAGGATSDKRGAQPGTYRVTVAEPAIPIDENSFTKAVTTTAAGDAPAAAIVLSPTKKGKASIPSVYSNPTSTPLVVTVPDAGGELNLELKSKP